MTEVLKDENGNIIKDPQTCCWCGMVFDKSLSWSSDVDKSPDECFTCWFWRLHTRRLDESAPTQVAIINGAHYFIEPDKQDGFMGFGGRKFIIQFTDGRTVITHNLWHQGEIPKFWKPNYPDNAKFITEKAVTP